MDRPIIANGLKFARVTVADVPALLVQRVARIRAVKSTDVGYLETALGSPTFLNHITDGQTGTQLPHITLRLIREFQVPWPSAERREELARNAKAMNDARQRVEAELERDSAAAEY